MRWRIMAAAAFCVAGWASGDVLSDPSREFLLPSGTLKAFAEYNQPMEKVRFLVRRGRNLSVWNKR